MAPIIANVNEKKMNLHDRQYNIYHFFIYYNYASTKYTTNNRKIACSITNTTKNTSY